MIKVRAASTCDRQAWDEYVRAHPDAGPYHLSAWNEAIECAYQGHVYGLIAESGSGISGVLPLAKIKLQLIAGSLISLPYCDYGGILASEPDAAVALQDRAINLAAGLHCRLELRCRDGLEILDQCPDFSVVTAKSRMVLELPVSAEALWNQLSSKLRSQVRRPSKEGFDFELGGSEALGDFYRIFCRNMRDLGSPVHSRKWFESILTGYDREAQVGLVKRDGVVVASGILLSCGETICNPWASSLYEYRRFSPNMLLYWGFLRHACDSGFRRFDFGRSTPGEGTFRFKEQWGAKPVPLHWYVERVWSAGRSLNCGGTRRLVERFWTRLPVKLATAVGGRIRRYISL